MQEGKKNIKRSECKGKRKDFKSSNCIGMLPARSEGATKNNRIRRGGGRRPGQEKISRQKNLRWGGDDSLQLTPSVIKRKREKETERSESRNQD